VRTIIISAHQDSLNYRYPFYRAPGADDDGSGSVTILQVLRSLVTEGFVPPPGIAIEWHWYAAEEGGLLGSQDVAAEYEKDNVDVKGAFQMDSEFSLDLRARLCPYDLLQ
jgi:bacterial leucyl aminopeptidase